jgi:DNA-binding transcriptional ArsR family regulator
MFTYGMTDELSAKVGVHSVERAADLFGLLSTPVRLRIILELRSGEKSVGELLAGVRGGPPHMSQHLTMMYRAGLVARREQGVQVYYGIANESVVSVCKIVCAQVTLNSDKRKALPVL